MSESTRARKPDRKFYRHPKYDEGCGERGHPQASYAQDGFRSQEVRSSDYSTEFHGCRSGRSRGRNYPSHSRRFTVNKFTKETSLSLSPFKIDASRMEELDVRYKTAGGDSSPSTRTDEERLETTRSESNAEKDTVTTTVHSPLSDSPTGKHGGLIRLPKDVDIYQNIEETKAGTSRRIRRGSQGNLSKPVVVVRPSFSHGHKQAESESALSATALKYRESLKIGFDGTTQPWLNVTNPPGSMAEPMQPGCAQAAFQLLCQGSGALGCDGAPVPELHRIEGHESGAMAPPPTVQPPNEKISFAIQQIVQLDCTLNILLIPPGLCAKAIPSLQPVPPHPQDGKEWTEAQLLILRWWAVVQRLRERLFVLFEGVVLTDLNFCNAAHVEQGMWKSVFYTILELLRSWISNPENTNLLPPTQSPNQNTDEYDQVASLLQQICLSDVIAWGETRLVNLLERIQAVHRIELSPLLSDGRPPPETRSRTRRLVYLSAQKLMLFLGDLARYKEVLTGERNFGKARSWYQKAQILVPKNGRSYNQLAVLAVYTSRHLDAMYYYMRTLAASNPFPTASQSLVALFSEIRPRADNLIRQIRKPKNESASSQRVQYAQSNTRFHRVELWIHPMDGQTTVLHGARRLTHMPHPTPQQQDTIGRWQNDASKVGTCADGDLDPVGDNDDEDDEDAQAELEEYANMSLIELSKQFGLTFIHAHGKLYTKIGMETFPEVASLALQGLSGLLAQKPCPLSGERLCQICIINMYNVDRAASLTAHASNLSPPQSAFCDSKLNASGKGSQSFSRASGSETLRSVHHDHAARFALDTFSLLCRRAAQLLRETPPPDAPPWWFPADAQLLLAALRLWSEWMILHPEHWLHPPNHRDPTLRPCLNDWVLVADLCTQAANWLNRIPVRPTYEEITPSTSLVLQLKHNSGIQDGEQQVFTKATESPIAFDAAFLFEEAFCAGFKPMLDLMPKVYRHSGMWPSEAVADFVRVEKLVLFGDFLCGIDSPVLTYNIEKAVYESAVERESSERKEDKQSDLAASATQTGGRATSESETVSPTTKNSADLSAFPGLTAAKQEPSADIAALQHQRALLQRQLEEESRLAIWRRNAIRQAASGGRRAIELEIRPIYLLPDTNCYIDWLEGIATLAQRSSNYTVVVPIVVVNELDTLARYGNVCANPMKSGRLYEVEAEVTRTGLIQERARAAIAYLEHEFAHRNSRLRALTARGSFMETIAYRNEINGGREPGQVNDDVILTCCSHFFKEDPDRFRTSRGLDQALDKDHPLRIQREIVLLTSDRNLRLKALNINVPARPLRTFVNWSRLPIVTSLPTTTQEPPLTGEDNKHVSQKIQPRGQWKQPLKH